MFQSITAVFAVSDYYAMDLICFLQEQGIKVPEQISVAGFDDIPMCRMFCPTLTTVKHISIFGIFCKSVDKKFAHNEWQKANKFKKRLDKTLVF